jgi:hypothetical protein
LAQKSQALAADVSDGGEVEHDVRIPNHGMLDPLLQSLSVREVDVSAEAQDQPPVAALRLDRG